MFAKILNSDIILFIKELIYILIKFVKNILILIVENNKTIKGEIESQDKFKNDSKHVSINKIKKKNLPLEQNIIVKEEKNFNLDKTFSAFNDNYYDDKIIHNQVKEFELPVPLGYI